MPASLARGQITLLLPVSGRAGLPAPSPAIGHAAANDQGFDNDIEEPTDPAPETTGATIALRQFRVPTLIVPASEAPRVLELLADLTGEDPELDSSSEDVASDALAEESFKSRWSLAESTRFFAAAARFVRHLLAQQRFVPMLAQESTGTLRGVWQPWLGDRATVERLSRLAAAMPASARACVDGFAHDGHAVVDDFVLRVGDAMCRRTLTAETMNDALDGRDARADAHVAWLSGLLGASDGMEGASAGAARTELVKHVRRWIGGLEERGSGASWRLLVRLQEPLDLSGLAEFASPGERVRWPLSFLLQSTLDEKVTVEAAELWMLPAGAASVEGMRIEAPHELLLAELGRRRGFTASSRRRSSSPSRRSSTSPPPRRTSF